MTLPESRADELCHRMARYATDLAKTMPFIHEQMATIYVGEIKRIANRIIAIRSEQEASA